MKTIRIIILLILISGNAFAATDPPETYVYTGAGCGLGAPSGISPYSYRPTGAQSEMVSLGWLWWFDDTNNGWDVSVFRDKMEPGYRVYYIVHPPAGYESCISTGAQGDSDGDGIDDCFDPQPNNTAPFSYRLFKHQGTEGNMTYMEFINEDGYKWGIGSYSPSTTSYIDMGSSFYSSTETDPATSENSYSKFITDNGLSCTGSPDVDFAMDQVAELNPATGEPSETGTGTTQGTDNTGNTSETDFLADIVSNTKATTDNLARLGD